MYKSDAVSVLPDEGFHIRKAQEEGGGVVVGVDAQTLLAPQVRIKDHLHAAAFIVENAEGRHAAGQQPQILLQSLGGGKGELRTADRFRQRPQIDPLVFHGGDKEVVLPLHIPQKKVLGHIAPDGQPCGVHILHGVHGCVLQQLKGRSPLPEQGRNRGLVVRHDSAAGGDDALALVTHKLTDLKVSSFYFISDFTVLALSLTYISIRKIGWSLLSVFISSTVIEIFRLPIPLQRSKRENRK